MNQAYQDEKEKRIAAEHSKDLESLRSELKDEINSKIGSVSSDLGVVASIVKEGTAPGKHLVRILTSPNLGGQLPPEPGKQAGPEQRNGILQQLTDKGLVTIVREKVVER